MIKLKISLIFLLIALNISAQTEVAQWNRYERTFNFHTDKNPFTDVHLSAVFVHDGTPDTICVDGFYDGNDKFVIRFMPTLQGKWTYVSHSTEMEMDGVKGSIYCKVPEKECHGLVKTGGENNFIYSDGTRYSPFGTTSYAWIYATPEKQGQTCASIKESGFNKLRFCVFPNNSINELPKEYPFKVLSENENEKGNIEYSWDFNQFNPSFFHHLENCIDSLKSMGVEADLILFTPYDKGKWGFDNMAKNVDMHYLEYVIARLSSFSNLWWSMANEWDLIKSKTSDDWIRMSEYVSGHDPYHHLLSIHGGTATYINYQLPCFTHASIQDQGPLYNSEGAATVRNIINKPIIFDEVCYEGNHISRWAQLSGEELLKRIWTGLIGGTYVTHGECFCSGNDYYTGNSFLATGGKFNGTSFKRIKFTKDIIESLPNSLRLADRSWDPCTASGGPGVYLIYFGDNKLQSWPFSLPVKNDHFPYLKGGEKFKVDIIDTWNMTIEHCPIIFEATPAVAKRMEDKDRREVKLPSKPYILIKILPLSRL